jgi:hypothetical protein
MLAYQMQNRSPTLLVLTAITLVVISTAFAGPFEEAYQRGDCATALRFYGSFVRWLNSIHARANASLSYAGCRMVAALTSLLSRLTAGRLKQQQRRCGEEQKVLHNILPAFLKTTSVLSFGLSRATTKWSQCGRNSRRGSKY